MKEDILELEFEFSPVFSYLLVSFILRNPVKKIIVFAMSLQLDFFPEKKKNLIFPFFPSSQTKEVLSSCTAFSALFYLLSYYLVYCQLRWTNMAASE